MAITHNNAGYDIIGDVHGEASLLEALLKQLGYAKKNGLYTHPDGRKAIFLGDIINKGNQQKQTIDIVRKMVDHGHGEMVLGNHELEIILRHDALKQSDEKPRMGKHRKFLEAYPPGSDRYKSVIKWLKKRPLYLEIDSHANKANCVHAYWDPKILSQIACHLDDQNTLSKQAWQEIARNQGLRNHIEAIVNGPVERVTTKKIRAHWWKQKNTMQAQRTYKARPPTNDPPLGHLQTFFMKASQNTAAPLFIGHYQIPLAELILTDKITCLDPRKSVAGYRWDGENEINAGKLYYANKERCEPYSKFLSRRNLAKASSLLAPASGFRSDRA